MTKKHVVRDGDCFTTIAVENGFFWKTLWDHDSNADLKALRKDPFTLAPGDVVNIPDLRPTEYTCATGKTHEFQRKGVPARLRIQLLDHQGNARANEAYELEIDGQKIESGKTTDGEGWVDVPVTPTAMEGVLRMDGGKEEHRLLLGYLRPIEDLVGVKMRLTNLGFYEGSIDDAMGDDMLEALVEFQAGNGLDPSGELDDATRKAIKKAHGG
ncbi:Hypothetical protein A7982_05591 [Minicystis rosea]|nr:Hypothetical protein A7982_05591 [Minicystis rosea]